MWNPVKSVEMVAAIMENPYANLHLLSPQKIPLVRFDDAALLAEL